MASFVYRLSVRTVSQVTQCCMAMVAVNAADQPLVRDVTLPTDAQTVTVYSDDKNLQGSVKQVKVKKNKVRINVPKNGAVVIL